ncbi:MAG: hypothetical protein Q8N51_03150 [Gammaproteobacteria bacterium]|nr:hypothetical protein [Gammaproteobacteria bacterium]
MSRPLRLKLEAISAIAPPFPHSLLFRPMAPDQILGGMRDNVHRA